MRQLPLFFAATRGRLFRMKNITMCWELGNITKIENACIFVLSLMLDNTKSPIVLNHLSITEFERLSGLEPGEADCLLNRLLENGWIDLINEDEIKLVWEKIIN